MDKSNYYCYEALARQPGVTLFGPGLAGYRPGMSVQEAVQVACAGHRPDVLIHGADLKESGIPAEQVAYMGDDLTDVVIMRRVGLSIATANARPEVKRSAAGPAPIQGRAGRSRGWTAPM